MSAAHYKRSRAIKTQLALPAEMQHALQSKLSSLLSLTKTEINDEEILVDYVFPDTSIAEIWRIILDTTDKRYFALLQYSHYSIAGFMEKNEQDFLLSPPALQYSVRQIYTHYFEQRNKKKHNAHKKQWQKYGKAKGK